jgi:hypothetical protein
MSGIWFLFDENVSHDLVKALKQAEPTIDFIVVGQAGAPPKGTPDPDLLLVAEREQRVFVSGDIGSVPKHVKAHNAAGHHNCGVVLLKRGFSIQAYVSDLTLIWGASEPAEWINRTDWIPY